LVNHLCARSRILFRHAHRAATVHSHLFEGWFDMRDLGAVLDHKEPCPIPHANGGRHIRHWPDGTLYRYQ
jgi:hypothetical protein